ncbi:MAG: hypothetical protein LN412_01935, partial [Candidatus Thermoplasmatota archaeon]|nr:hypothetical protein [Candidatus Thermoplasmatota archaeon]
FRWKPVKPPSRRMSSTPLGPVDASSDAILVAFEGGLSQIGDDGGKVVVSQRSGGKICLS